MTKKLISKLFHYEFIYDDCYSIDGGEQSLTEQYRFTHNNDNFFIQVRNISIKEKLEDIIRVELQNFGFVGPNDSLSAMGQWKIVESLNNLRIYYYCKESNETSIGILFFEKNGVFFEVMSTFCSSFEELEELIKGFDFQNVKQSHKLLLNGILTHTFNTDDFKVRIPSTFKRNGLIYTSVIQIYDDDKINKINLSFGRDEVKNEQQFKQRIQQMWGKIETTIVELKCKNIQWTVLSFITSKEIFGTKHHFFAYHQHNSIFYSVWLGLEYENGSIASLFTLILSNYSHDKLITKDKFPLYFHFNPEYSIHIPLDFIPINSADEYGLISDILPTMFFNESKKCRFFINATPLTDVSKETALDIINMERMNLKNQTTTQMISQKTQKYGKYDAWCDICKTIIQKDEVKCMVKYVYFKNPDVYVRFSFSAPENIFEDCYFNYKIPQLMESLDLTLLSSV